MRLHKKRNRHHSCRCGTGHYCPQHRLYSAPPPGTPADIPPGEHEVILRAPTEHGRAGGGLRVLRKQIGGA
jgi:hypothetical protein